MFRRLDMSATQVFQSAPLTEARGDMGFSPALWGRFGVSIRSPHRSKGRLPGVNTGRIWVEFQSAPLTEARGDLQSKQVVTKLYCFNPLPSPKQGETCVRWCLYGGVEVSIRSPHRSKGRRRPTRRPTREGHVSIRSPHRSKGRHPLMVARRRHGMFQSAPLTEARGDLSLFIASSRSARFQSAPLTEARGDVALLR